MLEYLLLHTKDYGDDDYRFFFSLCSEERRQKVLRHRFDEDKRLALLAEGMLRLRLGRRLACSPAELSISRGEDGKPYLAGTALYFNISHTRVPDGGRLLLAIADAPVGCDIERARIPSPGLLKKVCTTAEIDYIGGGDGMALRCAEVWTAKEAYLKHTGVGIACDLRTVETCENRTIRGTVNGLPLFHRTVEDIACSIVSMAAVEGTAVEPPARELWKTE